MKHVCHAAPCHVTRCVWPCVPQQAGATSAPASCESGLLSALPESLRTVASSAVQQPKQPCFVGCITHPANTLLPVCRQLDELQKDLQGAMQRVLASLSISDVAPPAGLGRQYSSCDKATDLAYAVN